MNVVRSFVINKSCSILQFRNTALYASFASHENGSLFLKLPKKSYSNVVSNDPITYAADIISSHPNSNIVAVVGAGISTPSGIPDFRSHSTGLYDNLGEYNLRNPMDIFDLQYFIRNPTPFFKLSKKLWPGCFAPNYVHFFLKLLSEKNKLLRIYTQNIDGLEYLAGIPDEEIIAAHGSFKTATCMKCHERYEGSVIKNDVMADMIPQCRNEWCQGIIKPDVVFFGEDLPRSFFQWHDDLGKSKLLLVLGTSLEVFPVAGIVYEAPLNLPRILFNKEIVPPFVGSWDTRETDAVYEGDVIEGIRNLVNKLQWNEEMNRYLENK